MTTRNSGSACVPLVSYVVVTHDRAPELVRSRVIKSILCQDYPRKELIVIGEQCSHLERITEGLEHDPGLERFLAVHLDRPSEERFCPWALVARARNAGIKHASGDFICCQDDDNCLDIDFTSSLLTAINRTRSKGAWCWRRMVEEDGRAFDGTYFPWITDDEIRRDILYEIWVKADILRVGSDVVRDSLWAVRGSERFATVDPNEWLVHRDVYRCVPYRERYTHQQITYHITFDDIWNQDLCNSGIPITCVEEPKITYYLGGASNTKPLSVVTEGIEHPCR